MHMELYECFLDANLDIYWRTWQVNLGGLFNMACSFLLMMLGTCASGDGLCMMINVSSSDQGLLAFSVNPDAIKMEITKGCVLEHLEIVGDMIVWLVAGWHEWLAGQYVSCTWDMEELMQMKDAIVEEDKLKLKIVF